MELAVVGVTLIKNWHRGPARDKMKRIYVSAKAIHWGNVELASLNKKGENPIFAIIWFRMWTISFEGIYMDTGGESHIDSDGEG